MIQAINDETREHFISKLTGHRDTEYSLWKATKQLKRLITQAAPIKNADGKWVRSNQEKANTFADHLAYIFTPNPSTTDESRLEDTPPLQEDVEIPPVTIKEVKHVIDSEISPAQVFCQTPDMQTRSRDANTTGRPTNYDW